MAAGEGIGRRRSPFELNRARRIYQKLACHKEHERCRARRGGTRIARCALGHRSLEGKNRLVGYIVVMPFEQRSGMRMTQGDSRSCDVRDPANVNPACHRVCRYGSLPVDVGGAEKLNDSRRKPVNRQSEEHAPDDDVSGLSHSAMELR